MNETDRRTCAETLRGPKIDARGNVAWRPPCKRRADIDAPDGKCWQHRRDRNDVWRARREAATP